MRAIDAILSVYVVAWVLLMGSAAGLDSAYLRTAYALGIATMVLPMALASLLERRR